MEAPNKIYLTEWEGKGVSEYETPWSTGYYDEDAHHCKNHEYIRKEALLEWANVHKTVIETNGEEDDAYTRGQYSVILTLIDKLNSM